jgi:adenylosuccinate lyase
MIPQNDLIERIRKTEFFKPIWSELDNMLDPKSFTGRSAEQVTRYCGEGGEVQKALLPYKKHIDASKSVELTV